MIHVLEERKEKRGGGRKRLSERERETETETKIDRKGQRERERKRQRENYLRIFQRPAAHKTTSLFIRHIKPTIPNSKYILKII